MARNATSLSARIRLLEKSLDKAARLPRGETMSFEPMMGLMGVSRPVLRDWCREIEGFAGSGCFDAGGNGIEWVFEPRATVLWLLRHFEAERGAASARARRMKDMAGGEALAAVPDDFDLRETRELIDAAMRTQDLRERQGALIDAAALASAAAGMFGAMQTAGLQAAQEMDPLGEWPPEIRSKVEDGIRGLMLKQQRAAREFLGKSGGERLNGHAAQPGQSQPTG
jgi:hypothetical protein